MQFSFVQSARAPQYGAIPKQNAGLVPYGFGGRCNLTEGAALCSIFRLMSNQLTSQVPES